MKGLTNYFSACQIQGAEQHCRFLARLRPEIRKLCVVQTYTNVEEVVIDDVEIKCVLGELGETPYEPMKEKHDETMSRKSTIDRQLHVLNETH